ncbi:MFS transporter [Aristophania vespae]|uniref:MFS transporter n=1 Tax=Aristophania vespae TaxID=2697033 RepID=A0A6P1NIM1_9PROT|nr:MFS transporter [Aristophania vespae]
MNQPDFTTTQGEHDDANKLIVSVLVGVAVTHACSDFIQSVLPSIYPLLKDNYALTYAQIGMISLIYQLVASILQPWIGLYADKHSMPFLLPGGMIITLLGIGLLAVAPTYHILLLACALIGVGSATFHPEVSRIARMASGGRFGTAQSVFQVGGYVGNACGPLAAALIIIPYGQVSVSWLMLVALLAIFILHYMSRWAKTHGHAKMKKHISSNLRQLSRKEIWTALSVVGLLMFAKFTYIASISNYYTFYLLERFKTPLPTAQLYLFTFLTSVAVGTVIGGPIGDRIGRKAVIWVSFIGVIPFSILMPHANLFWTVILTVCIGLVISSAFSALLVYAQDVFPTRIGMVAGMMFGTMFGISGISAAALGKFADYYGIVTVYDACGFLPFLGFATYLMPETHIKKIKL